jgi:hypothetical protein
LRAPVDLSDVVSVAAGYYHNMALRHDGTVRCWGAGLTNTGFAGVEFGQSFVPPNLGPVVAIAAGNLHSVALLADGAVRCWGFDNYGECMVPAGLGSVSAIAAGGHHTIAVSSVPSPPCPADFNDDYFVEGHDLGVLLSEWGLCITGAPSCRADLDGNGIVDGDDLGSFLSAWGRCRD